jgi:putative sterol carrier protein
MHFRASSLALAAAAVLIFTGNFGAAGQDPQGPRPVAEEEAKDTTPEQVFDGMRKSFRADKAKGAHIRYQFHFKAPQAGDWWIIVNDGAFTMGKGSIERPDVTMSCTGSDRVELSNGTLGGIRAYLTGRLHVSGSQSLARKLDEMFP